MLPHVGFNVGDGDLNPGLHACTAAVLPAEPFPQPCHLFLKSELQRLISYPSSIMTEEVVPGLGISDFQPSTC